jgi:hypothetical protein
MYCQRDILPTVEQAQAVARSLSPTQVEILRRLASCDEPICYFKGGFWSLPSIGAGIAPTESGKWRDRWSVTIQSLTALERSGILGRLATGTNYDVTKYPNLRDFVLTEKGLLIARAL